MKATKIMSKLLFLLLFLIFMSLNGCGLYKKVDARKVSPNVNERAETNIKEAVKRIARVLS